MELQDYMTAFSNLHTAKIKGHKAPHKAVLLLAIIDLVESNVIKHPQIQLSDSLVDTFNAIWNRYLGSSPIFIPNISQPFFHMQHEPFWELVEKRSANMLLAAESEPWPAASKKPLPKGGYSVKAMRAAFECAEISHSLFEVMQNADARAMLRVVLINGYLCNQPTKTMPHLTHLLSLFPLVAIIA